MLLLMALVGCDDLVLDTPGGDATDRVDTILALDGDVTAGQAAFDTHCDVCHDPNGAVDSVGPALAPWVQANSQAATIEVILNGQGAMPGQNVSDQETADLLAFMFDAWGGDAIDGEALFTANCVVCHPADGGAGIGSGMASVVPPMPVEQLEAVISNGFPPSMPAFSGRLTSEEITALAAWLKAEWP